MKEGSVLRNGEWVALPPRTQRPDPRAELVESQKEETRLYRWIEPEKSGRDIGRERAAQGWSHKHFPELKRYVRNRADQKAWCKEERGMSVRSWFARPTQ